MHLPTLIGRGVRLSRLESLKNADWLQLHMSPYFFQAMTDEEEALTLLAREMGQLRHNRHLILSDKEKRLVIACGNTPGSLYETLRRVGDRNISYAMFSHSNANMPGLGQELEIQRLEFDLRSNQVPCKHRGWVALRSSRRGGVAKHTAGKGTATLGRFMFSLTL